MTYPDLVSNFLQKHRISVLSLVDAENAPHSSALHYAWDESRNLFLFFTRTKTKKYELLSSGIARASLVIGFSEEEFITVQLQGNAAMLHDEEAKAAYLQKFPHIRQRVHDADAIFLCFEPTWFRYTDYKPTEPIIFTSLL